MLAPYVLVFAVMVVYPVAYGLWIGLDINAYRQLFADPIFIRTIVNTIVFLFVAVNLKFLIALLLSGFFVAQRAWVRFVLVLFILPWAVPSIPTILSFRVMLNPENGHDQFSSCSNGSASSRVRAGSPIRRSPSCARSWCTSGSRCRSGP